MLVEIVLISWQEAESLGPPRLGTHHAVVGSHHSLRDGAKALSKHSVYGRLFSFIFFVGIGVRDTRLVAKPFGRDTRTRTMLGMCRQLVVRARLQARPFRQHRCRRHLCHRQVRIVFVAADLVCFGTLPMRPRVGTSSGMLTASPLMLIAPTRLMTCPVVSAE